MLLGERFNVLAEARRLEPSRRININEARSSGFKWLYDFSTATS